MSLKEIAASLPQTKSNWYVFYSLLRTWVADEAKEPVRPYLFVVIDLSSQFILNSVLLNEEPTATKTLEIIFNTMTNPKIDKVPNQRPKTIKFEHKVLADEVTDGLSEINVTARFAPERRLSKSILKNYYHHMYKGEPELEGLSSRTGLAHTSLRGFYRAAAEFFRAEPWVYLSDNDVLSIQIPPGEAYYVTILGQAGMEYGMVVFKKWEDLVLFKKSQPDEASTTPQEGWHVLTFEEKYTISFDDLDDIELHDFEIAVENAYPFPMNYFENRESERPSREMIFWYQGALQAVTRFVITHFKSDQATQKDETHFQFNVVVGQKQVDAEIIYPVEGIPLYGYIPPMGQFSPLERMGFGDIGHDDINLREAQEIIYDAWEEDDPDDRVRLAQQALTISEDCVDAYVILAEDLAANYHQKLNYYQMGVEVGEKFLGKEYFKENKGHFWGLIETRPYMRALAGQANCLWVTGDRPKALETYRRMLDLNPGDNQGIRYLLLDFLLEMEKYKEVKALIKEYGEVWDAPWLFTKALLKYKNDGPTPAANKMLAEAIEYNPFVKPYLIGEKRIPHNTPPYHGFGDENEAIFYAEDHLNHWRRVPGAVDWLKNITDDL